MNYRRPNKEAFKKAFWSAFSRVIGVILGVECGAMVHQLLGEDIKSWGLVSIFAVVSVALIWYAEYERVK